MRSVT